jgi:hypothetical protein
VKPEALDAHDGPRGCTKNRGNGRDPRTGPSEPLCPFGTSFASLLWAANARCVALWFCGWEVVRGLEGAGREGRGSWLGGVGLVDGRMG